MRVAPGRSILSDPVHIHILDTCVVSELVRKRPDQKVVDWVTAQAEHTLYLSILTFGELNKGIVMLPDQDRRKHRLKEWLRRDLHERFRGRVLGLSEEVVLRWGEIDGEAERNGKQIPVIDGLIAATALVAGAVVVTRNELHFQRSGAEVINPWAQKS
ncbi:MAG: type II toxin-antitoxin system VapC family toxin [Acidobacteria bacterium]|nr:type II toxin-antitoxin system VapC family toxin [Acidobacteriota bacterium]